MAFGRDTQLSIGLNNNIGIEISNLNFTFDIERSTKPENNTAKFNIYNAKRETRDKALIKDNNIFLRAGYKDENNLGLIFSGIIQQATTKKDRTHYVTEITALDFGSNSSIKKQQINFNFNTGITYGSIISDLASIISVPVAGIENISNLILNNGFVFYGTVIELIRKLQKKLLAYNVGLYFDLGEMVIWKTDQTPTKFDVVYVSPESGLIGEVEEIIDEGDDKKDTKTKGTKRISFVSLLNSKFKPQTIVKVKSEKIEGAFIIEKIFFKGSNISAMDEFTATVEALAE